MGTAKPSRDDRHRRQGVRDDDLTPGLAYTDAAGRIYFDSQRIPLADDGACPRLPRQGELIAAPPGTVPSMLPGRAPLLRAGRAGRATALAALLPAGFTRLLLPAYARGEQAPPLPLFGYTYACVVDDALWVAAARTDAGDDWTPRYFAPGDLDARIERRRSADPGNRALAQVALCSRDYGCFTAQNVFLERGEAALPVSPRCNAACVGCISQLDSDSPIPAPQSRLTFEPQVDELTRIAVHHLERVPDGIVSFGQGCEGEPLLRAPVIARTIAAIRARTPNGTINLNTNGSLPRSLTRVIEAGLQAVRISLNSFRPAVYAAYYRPTGYDLDDVLASIAAAVDAGLRVSLNYLTHPGVTDDPAEVEAFAAFVRAHPVAMVQTRTLNIDPEQYLARIGRPLVSLGMVTALARMRELGLAVGNFTHAH